MSKYHFWNIFIILVCIYRRTNFNLIYWNSAIIFTIFQWISISSFQGTRPGTSHYPFDPDSDKLIHSSICQIIPFSWCKHAPHESKDDKLKGLGYVSILTQNYKKLKQNWLTKDFFILVSSDFFSSNIVRSCAVVPFIFPESLRILFSRMLYSDECPAFPANSNIEFTTSKPPRKEYLLVILIQNIFADAWEKVLLQLCAESKTKIDMYTSTCIRFNAWASYPCRNP